MIKHNDHIPKFNTWKIILWKAQGETLETNIAYTTIKNTPYTPNKTTTKYAYAMLVFFTTSALETNKI